MRYPLAGCCIAAMLLELLCSRVAGAQRVDCWWEEPSLLVLLDPEDRPVAQSERKAAEAGPVELDYAHRRAGDCSLRYTAPAEGAPLAVGLTPEPYQSSWTLGPEWTLHLWLRCSGEVTGPWTLVLLDSTGKRATANLAFTANDAWHALVVPLSDLKPDDGFDLASIATIRLGPPLPAGSRLWLDDVRWSNGEHVIGVTDKSIEQRMAETAASRPLRLQRAFEDGVAREDDSEDRRCYDRLYAGRDLPAANQDLRRFFQEELELCRSNQANLWTLSQNTRMINAYYHLGSRSQLQRLEPETEKLLLELLWERTKDKNDIALTRWSTWWMVGSENHDLNAKACSLVSAHIFMDEPEYASRIYPDAGHGDGHAYWFHDKGGRLRGEGRPGRANLKDGNDYVARDHYEAWVRYMNEYFAERARKGFFLERGSPTYFKWTMSFILLIHDHSGDEQLRHQARQFLDLAWADWAQEQIAGIRGGPKTRHHASIGGYDSGTNLARFYTGGDLGTNLCGTSFLLSDYAWPQIVWDMALDRASMGCYAAVSRGIGEEETTRPRPPGTERSMLGNRESRLLKYAWVTPEYILGAQMDHPDAVYNHLAHAGRWHGLIVGASPATRIVPTAGLKEGAQPHSYAHDMEWVYHAVQHRQVLITQQAKRWTSIHPDWYPSNDNYSKPMEIYVGRGWDQVREQDGWVFFEKADAYAAVRVLDGQKQELPGARRPRYVDQADPDDHDRVLISQKTFEWNEARMSLKLLNKFSPVIIEAGRRADHPTLADFQAAILANPLKLQKAAVPGFYIVHYRGCGPDARELVFNAANPSIPTIDGTHVDYTPPKVFDSPFIQSDYDSGIVTLTKGPLRQVLDFNNALVRRRDGAAVAEGTGL